MNQPFHIILSTKLKITGLFVYGNFGIFSLEYLSKFRKLKWFWVECFENDENSKHSLENFILTECFMNGKLAHFLMVPLLDSIELTMVMAIHITHTYKTYVVAGCRSFRNIILFWMWCFYILKIPQITKIESEWLVFLFRLKKPISESEQFSPLRIFGIVNVSGEKYAISCKPLLEKDLLKSKLKLILVPILSFNQKKKNEFYEYE